MLRVCNSCTAGSKVAPSTIFASRLVAERASLTCPLRHRHVLLFERPDWQAQALAVIPVASLVAEAASEPMPKRKVVPDVVSSAA